MDVTNDVALLELGTLDGAGAKALIWGDVNRDGQITKDDENGKTIYGIVVMADLDGV